LRIGARTNINSGALLDGRGGLVIGEGVNISPGVSLLTSDHDPSSPSFAGRTRPVTIGARAWIATGAIVLPGTSLGDGVIVAAGTVARGTVEPNAIIAGNPAKVVSPRPEGAQVVMERYRRFLH
jgi:maltose O-acetyltransferase